MRHSKLSSESSSGTLYPTKIYVFFEIFQKAFVIFPKNHRQKVHFEHRQSAILLLVLEMTALTSPLGRFLKGPQFWLPVQLLHN